MRLASGKPWRWWGESGSGKSVTALSIMRLLAGPQVQTRGRVLFEGRDLLALPTREMQHIRGNRIGMVFQEPMTSLNPVLKIGTQITEVLQRHRGDGSRQCPSRSRTSVGESAYSRSSGPAG
ncbi:hypothetical protein OS31_39790 [Dickeya oryzae]